jgi:Ran GTPase-activating protein (RanGAP) involved in mRNA processing and transport
MGPKGGVLVCKAVEKAAGRLVAVNLTGNRVGSISCIALHTALMMPTCSLQTLLLASNDVCDDGANVLARALLQNDSLTELDLSNNGLTEEGAVALASAFRGKYSDGRKLADLRLKKLLISSNPAIGKVGARALLQSFTEGLLEHFEAADIGAGEDAAACVAKGVRDVAVLWRHINCAYNSFGRVGLNTICWGLRVNRRVKVVNLGSSKAGLAFGTPTDALGIHGISLARMVAENTTLTMLDLSHNNLSSEAGIVLFNALKANFSLTLVNLRGNQFDDEVESALGDLLATNDIIEELDIGDNKLGCRACYAISTGLCYNNSIRVMKMDSNRFGYFKSDAFVHLGRMIGYNTTIRRMHLDDNRVGAEGGTLVAQGVARNSTLVSLSMHNNRLDSRSGREMVNAYRHNTVMVELSLTEDEVGQDVWEDFRAVRESKRAFINPLADD